MVQPVHTHTHTCDYGSCILSSDALAKSVALQADMTGDASFQHTGVSIPHVYTRMKYTVLVLDQMKHILSLQLLTNASCMFAGAIISYEQCMLHTRRDRVSSSVRGQYFPSSSVHAAGA